MLTVRVLPRAGVTLRAAAATVEVTTVLAVGHVWAGGSLPSAPWLLVMATAVLGAGLLVLRGRVRPVLAVPALVVVQLLLHAWLTALTEPTPAAGHLAGAAHGAHAAHAEHAHALLDPRMLLVHAVGGLLTALLWELRARVVEVVVAWVRQPLPPVPAPRTTSAPTSVGTLVSRLVVESVPRRGPPVGPATA